MTIENIKIHIKYLASQGGMILNDCGSTMMVVDQETVLTIHLHKFPQPPQEVKFDHYDGTIGIDVLSPISVADGLIRCQVALKHSDTRFWAEWQPAEDVWVCYFGKAELVEPPPEPSAQAWEWRSGEWLDVEFDQKDVYLDDGDFWAEAKIAGARRYVALTWDINEERWEVYGD